MSSKGNIIFQKMLEVYVMASRLWEPILAAFRLLQSSILYLLSKKISVVSSKGNIATEKMLVVYLVQGQPPSGLAALRLLLSYVFHFLLSN